MEKNSEINSKQRITILLAVLSAAVIGFIVGSLDLTIGEPSLTDKVQEHIIFNEGEQPAIYDINNVDSLKEGNVFYANAENGDKLLIFQNRAMIYSVEKDVIVNVAPYLGGEDFDPNEPIPNLSDGVSQNEEEESAE